MALQAQPEPPSKSLVSARLIVNPSLMYARVECFKVFEPSTYLDLHFSVS